MIICNACGRAFDLADEPEKTIHLEIKDGKGVIINCYRACRECRLVILARLRGFDNINREQVWSCSNTQCVNFKSDFWSGKHEDKITSTTRPCKLCGSWKCFIYKDQY